MKTNDNRNNIFDPSGCLSEAGIRLYVTGNLERAEKLKVEDHLSACPFCADATEGFRLLAENHDDHDMKEISGELNQKVDERLHATGKGKRIAFSPMVMLAVAASVVVFFGFYYVIRLYLPAGTARLSQQMQDKVERSVTMEMFSFENPGARLLSPNLLSTLGKADSVSLLLSGNSGPIYSDAEPAENDDVAERTEEHVMKKVRSRAVSSEKIMVNAGDTVKIEPDLAMNKKYKDYSGAEGSIETKTPSQVSAWAEEKASITRKKAEDVSVFSVVEEMPNYPGGDQERIQFLKKNLKYPESARSQHLEGVVYLQFIVTEKGKLENVRVVKGIGGGCDEEALRVVKMMPPWIPGRQAGKLVKVKFTMPVRFSLD